MNGSPGWDAIIILVYVIGIGYNVILHRDKIAGHIASAYISLAVTAIIAKPVADYVIASKTLMAQPMIAHNASIETISAVVFIGLTVVLSSFLAISPTGRRSDDLSALEAFTYAFLFVTLVLSTILSYLPEAKRATYLASGKFIPLIWQFHTWWLVIPAFLLIYSGFRRGSSRS